MATMADASDALAGEDGGDSVPATKPAAEHTVPIDEQIRKDFNFTEFFQLASRVIDDGDVDSMAALLELKRRWSEKFGEDDSLGGAGHGGIRFPSRPLTFTAPLVARPACRFPGLPTSEQAARILQGAAEPRSTRLEPPTTASGAETLHAARVLLNPNAAPTLGLAAHPSNVVSSPAGPLPTVALPPTCLEPPTTPLGTVTSHASTFCGYGFEPYRVAAIGVGKPSMHVGLSPSTVAPPPTTRLEPPTTLMSACPTSTVAPPLAMDGSSSSAQWLAAPRVSVIQPSDSTDSPPSTALARQNSSSAVHVPPPVDANPPPPKGEVSPPAATAVAHHSGQTLAPSLLPTAGSFPNAVDTPTVPYSLPPPTATGGDKITKGFHNSSRKTLSFIPPSLQNGEVVVRPSIDLIRNGSTRWKTTAVGYFLGKRPYFHHLNAYVRCIWPAVREVTATVTGFYFFQFKTEAAMEEVIEGEPWLFQGQPIVLQKWEPGMALRKLKHTQVPVWIKLRHLPVELWTTDGLSTVASGIGKPLYPDAITRACMRLDFARVCVMLDISSKLPRHVIIMIPLKNGEESACKVDVEYEWLPPKCTSCHSLGHATSACVLLRPSKPAVAVYVQKPNHVATSASISIVEPTPKPLEDEAIMESDVVIKDKGKQIVLFNTFDLLQSTNDDAECSSRGPNESSPLGVDPC
ncbi:UNVERIFIED_CONTAM: hypothetical protein Scaly_2853900 [Sesamum calycinum]|uniref:DUF4283 domain-containing protein n=1 Tax=Sesamum calycinum TaxID=2727403 RepID=A0AAW2LHW3_9LAMI